MHDGKHNHARPTASEPRLGVHSRFLAPNLITCANLALGCLSVVVSFQGNTTAAGWLIVMAVLFDKLDGTVARLLNASSEFGEQLDSFSDFLAFGVAPAVLFFKLFGADSPVITYSCGILYVIACALRLAKFNVLGVRLGRDYFFGMPTPVAGSLIVSLYLTVAKHEGAAWLPLSLDTLSYLVPIMQTIFALWMVSDLPLPKLRSRASKLVNAYQTVSVALIYLIGLTWFLLPDELRLPEFLLFSSVLYISVGGTWAYAKGIRLTDMLPESDR